MKEIKEKAAKIENARKRLKSEFVGIDKCIDEVIQCIEPWYYYPDLQERPTVVNLWGMTGTGKTEMVKKLVHYLGLDKSFIHTNAADFGSERNMDNTLTELFGTQEGKPSIICLDEFQYLADHKNQRNGNSKNQKIWDLLDSGMLQLLQFDSSFSDMLDFTAKLRTGISNGMEVRGGMITKNAEAFISFGAINPLTTKISEKNKEVADYYVLTTLFEYERENWEDYYDFVEAYKKLDAIQILDLAMGVVEKMRRPKIYNASKSLIFIIGNLDRAYRMSGSLNPDDDADIFHKHSLQINLTDIKDTLGRQFRREQISRLGNNHVIYPALSSNDYRSVIHKLLQNAGTKFYSKMQVLCDFDKTLEVYLYKESVFPSQGVRPVYSTLRTVVEGSFGRVALALDKLGEKPTKLSWSWKEDEIHIYAVRGERKKLLLKIKAEASLDEIRLSRDPELQSVIATHESGHAILAIQLLKRVPDQVISASVMNNKFGYVSVDMSGYIFNTETLLAYLAYLLGGRAAEKLVFGEDNMSLGSESDLQEATELATHAYYRSGMDMAGYFTRKNEDHNEFLEVPERLKSAVKIILEEAESLAETVLGDYKKQLATLMKYLSGNPSIDKNTLEEILGIPNLDEQQDCRYSNGLKEFIEKQSAYDFALN